MANPGLLNISIAFGASIENATGGQASDYIIGNILTNTLSGGAGDDVLYAEEVVTNYDPGLADYRRITNSGSYTLGPLAAVQAFNANPASQRDTLYGDGGNDYLAGGRGSDLLHGGAQSTTTSPSSAIESDGLDVADYAPLGLLDATKGIAIRLTDQALDATLAANVDAGCGTWVTDRGRGGGTDLLVSIETIKATAADDVLVVTKLDPLRLAGADGTGGLATVDLGDQSTGDLIDLSTAISGMTAAMAGTTPRLYATDTPALKLTVIGAEKVLGSAYNDVMNGGIRADTFAGGAGDDRLSGAGGDDILFTGTSGSSGDQLDGGDGKDRLIAEAGSSAVLTGAAGDDTFYVARSGAARTVTINASEAGDTLVWNGHQLTHGDLYIIDGEGSGHIYDVVFGYLGSRGEVYRLTALDPASASDLIITFPDANKIVVHDWSQGKLGITLDGGAMPAYGVTSYWWGSYPIPASNQWSDGTLYTDDWDTIDNAQASLATPGSVAAPPPPVAFTDAPAMAPLALAAAHGAWWPNPAQTHSGPLHVCIE